MTIAVAVHKLPASTLVEVREACKTLGFATIDWTAGALPGTPLAVISGLDQGVRRIPEDLMALVEAVPGLRLVLCTQEPLVKPWVVVGDGRVCVLGPPIDRTQIIATLRTATQPLPLAVDGSASRRFEVLRRSHWIAWIRGRTGPAISLHEDNGATVVIGGPAHNRSAIADVMVSTQRDADRESALGALAGNAAVAHLNHNASEWLMYWPIDHCPLWLYSPDRIPAHWDAARGISSVANRRLLRLPAFPSDQLVAAWSEAPINGDALALIQDRAVDGGTETITGLDRIADRHSHVTGLVMEVR